MKPSVTKLIGLLDKPALLKWANKIGLEGIKLDEYRKKSLSDGDSLHKQIESFIRNKTPFTNLELKNNFERYFQNKKIIESEKEIETDYFTGRLDIKIKYNSKIFLCDFKSNQKAVYFENKLQLVAYGMAEQCDGFGIISIPDLTFLPVFVPDRKPYEKILINLSEIYALKNQLQ